MKKETRSALTNLIVWVAGLGYFVDMFDITLFGVIRTSSLLAIGIDKAEHLTKGTLLYNMQFGGMIIGGILWGILADKKGRLSVLFGSIIMYSLANLANAFVWDINSYAICRLIAGIGLAGELGAAITLVSETLPKESRGIGTTIVATLGLLGSVTAALIGQKLPWNIAYIIGGVLGLLLLLTRFKVFESGIFDKQQVNKSDKGNLAILFSSPQNIWKYLSCVFVGAPIYFMTGVLFTFAPELTKGLSVIGEVSAAQTLFYGSIGLTIGDLLSGLLSQLLKSRKKAVLISLLGGALLSLAYIKIPGLTAQNIYYLCFFIGIFAGFWAVLVTISAEQFGTNIRGTVATTVPNFVRGTGIVATTLFAYLKSNNVSSSDAAMYMIIGFFGLALIALFSMRETFGKNLDYTETSLPKI